MSKEADTNRKTIAIDVRNPTIRFALNILLSPFADVISIDDFSLKTRQFEPAQRSLDLIISDLDSCNVQKVQFEWSYSNKVQPACLALVPMRTAATYFFRFQRAKLPFCLWRSGLDNVSTAVQTLLREGATPTALTLTENEFNFLSIGTNDQFCAQRIPEQFRCYLPRLGFDIEILQAEFKMRSSDILDRLENLRSTLGVQTNQEAIKVAEWHGIRQLSLDHDVLEERIFEANAITLISKWLSNEKAKKF